MEGVHKIILYFYGTTRFDCTSTNPHVTSFQRTRHYRYYNFIKISTMKATPYFEEVVHVAAQFLESIGHQAAADKLRKEYPLPEWVDHNNPLLAQSLVKIVKEYVRNKPKIAEYLISRVAPATPRQSLISPNVNLKSLKAKKDQKTWLNCFEQPKKLEDIQDTKWVEPMKQKLAKNKQVQTQSDQSSDYESEKDSFVLEPSKKLKKEVLAKKKEVLTSKKEVAKEEEKTKVVTPDEKDKNTGKNGHKLSFSRIDVEKIGFIPDSLRDNSFEAKFRFGQGGDDWGREGYDKLKGARGEAFKKAKGKLKNKAYQGGSIDCNRINSIPILY